MGLLYDITKDYLYQQGQQETKRQMIEDLIKLRTISLESIAQVARVSVKYVQQIAAELEK